MYFPGWLQHPGLGEQERVPEEYKEHVLPVSLLNTSLYWEEARWKAFPRLWAPLTHYMGAGLLLRSEGLSCVVKASPVC